MNIHPKFKQRLPHLYHDVLANRHAFQHITAHLPGFVPLDSVRTRLSDPDRETGQTLETLYQLPFSEFFTHQNSQQETYLLGLTHPIFYLHDDRSYQGPGCLGEYYIAVPWSGIIEERVDGFHFIPMVHMTTPFRHFHHCLDPEARRKENPLDEVPTTCWGGIAPLILDALFRVDVAAIFEYACIFLNQVNLESILCTPFHATRLSLSEYAAAINVTDYKAFNILWGNMDDIIF